MISPQDFDRLSAYLDHQLSPAETADLEARLARDPELKAALSDLRWTVRALQTLPRVKPPRNFTLSPKQVRSLEAPRPAFSVFRFASALAAIVLVVVLAGDLGSGWLAAPRAAAPAPAAQSETAAGSAAPTEGAVAAYAPMPATPEATAAPATGGASDKAAVTDENTTTADSAQPAVASAEAPTSGFAAGGGGAPLPTPTPMDTNVLEAGASRSSTTATAAPPEAAPPAALPTETPMATAQAVLSTEAITPAAAPTEAPVAAALPMSSTEVPTPLPPTEAPLAVAEAATPARVANDNAAPSTPAQPETGWLTPMRGVEIGLVVLSVLLAGLAWLARKR